MKRTPKSLNLHRIDAWNIFVFINTLNVVVPKTAAQSATNHIFRVVRIWLFVRAQILHVDVFLFKFLVNYFIVGAFFRDYIFFLLFFI